MSKNKPNIIIISMDAVRASKPPAVLVLDHLEDRDGVEVIHQHHGSAEGEDHGAEGWSRAVVEGADHELDF